MNFAINLRYTFIVALTIAVSFVSVSAITAREETREVVRVAGLSDSVEIRRDQFGVAHIRAMNEPDAHFGLGFAHAQDRLWQMEFQRRIGNGQLAEILGAAGLPTDKLFRTIGLRRAADAALERLSARDRAPIDSYVAGVNAFLSSQPINQLPTEFQLLGIQPAPWTAEDVLVLAKVVAWGVSSNWDKELLAARIVAKLGPTKTAELMPAYTADGPTILPTRKHQTVTSRKRSTTHQVDTSVIDGLLALNRKVEEQTGLGADGFGSNSWVLHGSRTTTGQPLLANDPHLASQTPAIWYMAHVSGGNLDVTGASIPGAPGIFIGHNNFITWGVTTINVDSQDIYLEHINANNEVEFNGTFEPVAVVPETIKVKGQPDVTLKVRITRRHGPLISDLINPTGTPMALRWTGNDPDDSGINVTLAYNRARSWQEFTDATRVHRPTDQNYVFADGRGNIGYIAAAAIPVRPDSDDGRLPVQGWTGTHEWRGFVPFEDLPTLYNPPSGFIVTANNKVAGDDYPYLIGTNFAAPYRAARVIEMIKSKQRHSLRDMTAMQGDVLAMHAREVLPFMLKSLPAEARAQQAIDLLQGWDGRVTAESAAAAVFEAWYLKLGERLFADELWDQVTGDALWRSYSENIYFVAMALEAALEKNSSLCDDVGTPVVESCSDTVAASLTDGLAKMTQAQGTSELTSWRWDRVHHAVFPHSPFDANPQLKPIFSREIPNGGDKFTVNVASVFIWDQYQQLHAAQYRQIVDLSDLNNSQFIVAPGQSGLQNSPHYDDLLERWQQVKYLPIYSQPTNSDSCLVLRP